MGMGNRMRTKMRTDTLFKFMNILQVIGVAGMAGVAQLVELWIVIPVVEGSIPFARPISNCSRDNNLQNSAYFFSACGRSSTG